MPSITLDADLSKRLEFLGATDDESKDRIGREVLRQVLPLADYELGGDELRALEVAFQRQVRIGLDSGPGREWSDADWERLYRGERRHAPSADSWAVPPSRSLIDREG